MSRNQSLLADSDFILLTAGTPVVDGAYQWTVTSAPSPGYDEYHWGGEIAFAHSTNGVNWNYISDSYGQFAIDATAVPEPCVFSLFALGGLCFLWCRRRFC